MLELFWQRMSVPGSSMLDTKVSDGSGSKIFNPGRVSHLWFRFGFGKFPLETSNFSIFSGQKKSLQVVSKSTRVKGWLASYLLRAKSNCSVGSVSAAKIRCFYWNSQLHTYKEKNIHLKRKLKKQIFWYPIMWYLLNESAVQAKPFWRHFRTIHLLKNSNKFSLANFLDGSI